jgi:hypothetical protein
MIIGFIRRQRAEVAPSSLRQKDRFMTANDLRELALGFDDAEESAHMGTPDFRVGGRIFATLAHEHLGLGNLMLSPELQQFNRGACEPFFGLEWIESKVEAVAAAGWSTLGTVLTITPDDELDMAKIGELLGRVAKAIHDQPNRVRLQMNGFVIDVGAGNEASRWT